MVKKHRVRTIDPMPWCRPVESTMSRPSTEQLWVAHRGTGAELSTKYKKALFQVENMPELVKARARARGTPVSEDWNNQRPYPLIEAVSAYVKPTAKIIDLFGDQHHADAATLSPVVLNGFTPALSSSDGCVGAVKKAIQSVPSKAALKSLLAKSKKTDGHESVQAILDGASTAEGVSAAWDTNEHKRLISSAVEHAINTQGPTKRRKVINPEHDGKEVKRYGIASPSAISDELCQFLGLEPGTEFARTQAVKSINTYITEHKLRDKTFVNMDDALKKLFRERETPILQLSISSALSPHYASKAKPELIKFLALSTGSIPRRTAEKLVMEKVIAQHCLNEATGMITPAGDMTEILGDNAFYAKDLGLKLEPFFVPPVPKKRKAKVEESKETDANEETSAAEKA